MRRPMMPAHLREFNEADWPPQPNECLERYSCRWPPDDEPCTPPPEGCGAVFYAAHADNPELVARYRRMDAYERWSRARQAWAAANGHNVFLIWIKDLRSMGGRL